MEDIQEEEQITLQQYLLSNSQILSIEKSDTPQVNKWWILTKKTDLQKVTEFLNTDMVHYMSFVNPIQRPYTPPNQITTNRIMAPETDKNVTKFSQRLKNRLQQRPKLNQIIQTPPQTGRNRRSYAAVTSTHKGTQSLTKPPIDYTDIQRKTNETNEKLQQLTSAVNDMKTIVTSPSSITSGTPEPNTNIIKQLSEESDKKMQHMMQEFRETMQSMMQNFMQHISTMLTNLLPTIIQSMTNNTQQNITVQHPPPHPTPPLTNLNTSTPFQNTQKFKPHTKDPPTQYKIHGVPQSTGSPQLPV
jgi:hypothetical protein